MARIKFIAPVFKGGVRIHNTGEVLELEDAEASRAVRRGWAGQAAPEKEGGEGGTPDKKAAGKSGAKG